MAGQRLPYKLEYMAAQGRSPSFDSTGNIRGFRSRPGAPQSPMDSMTGRGIPNNPKGGLSSAEDWGAFFKGNSPTGVRIGYAPASPSIAAAAFPTGQPRMTTGNLTDGGYVGPITPTGNLPDVPTPGFSTPEGNADTANPFPNLPAPGMDGLPAFTSTPPATEYLGNVISTARDYLKRFPTPTV